MPQRRNRVRLTAPRRQRQSSVDQGEAESAGTPLDTAPDVGDIQEESNGTVVADQRLDIFAQLLWLSAAGLRRVALIEAELNGAYAEVEGSVSDYRLRQMARDVPEAQRKRDDVALRLSQDKERARRERDYHHVPLMQLAMGIKMLDKQVKQSVWVSETMASYALKDVCRRTRVHPKILLHFWRQRFGAHAPTSSEETSILDSRCPRLLTLLSSALMAPRTR